ncbi:MAG: hypothetical protein J6S41_00405, partial [Clostridia bacterium]|nr:hypothetical protein [Clostridia bacterium]
QFGLHATSVNTHLDSIARVDKRVEIVWEDCGEFPYGYTPRVESEAEFEKSLDFTRNFPVPCVKNARFCPGILSDFFIPHRRYTMDNRLL